MIKLKQPKPVDEIARQIVKNIIIYGYLTCFFFKENVLVKFNVVSVKKIKQRTYNVKIKAFKLK